MNHFYQLLRSLRRLLFFIHLFWFNLFLQGAYKLTILPFIFAHFQVMLCKSSQINMNSEHTIIDNERHYFFMFILDSKFTLKIRKKIAYWSEFLPLYAIAKGMFGMLRFFAPSIYFTTWKSSCISFEAFTLSLSLETEKYAMFQADLLCRTILFEFEYKDEFEHEYCGLKRSRFENRFNMQLYFPQYFISWSFF